MANTRCNYCGQIVQFIDIRGNSTCPVCRQSSTSCCEGGSCGVAEPFRASTETPLRHTKMEEDSVSRGMRNEPITAAHNETIE